MVNDVEPTVPSTESVSAGAGRAGSVARGPLQSFSSPRLAET
jgi:hypothetical protein